MQNPLNIPAVEFKVSFEMFYIIPSTDIFNLQLKACYGYKSPSGKSAVCVLLSLVF